MAVKIKSTKPRVAIGIDPSTKTGLSAVCLDTGKVLATTNIHQASSRVRAKVKQKRCPYDRLNSGRDALIEFLNQFDVHRVFIEKYAFNLHGKIKQSPDSMIVQCRYGEMIRYTLWLYGLDFVEVTPTQLKQYVLGIGKGGKDEIRLGVYKRWGIECKTDDECDAVVLAKMGAACTFGNVECETKEQQKVLDKVFSADYNSSPTVNFDA